MYLIEFSLKVDGNEKIFTGSVKSKSKKSRIVQGKIAKELWPDPKHAKEQAKKVIGLKTLITRI